MLLISNTTAVRAITYYTSIVMLESRQVCISILSTDSKTERNEGEELENGVRDEGQKKSCEGKKKVLKYAHVKEKERAEMKGKKKEEKKNIFPRGGSNSRPSHFLCQYCL